MPVSSSFFSLAFSHDFCDTIRVAGEIEMEKRYKLTVEEILDKQFNVDFKGYSSVEVDEFLDLVMADYQQYNEAIAELGSHLNEYERQINALKAKIVELEGKNAVNGELPQGSQVDILKRLSRLENEVFKKSNQ